jgi:lipoprotein NlpI
MRDLERVRSQDAGVIYTDFYEGFAAFGAGDFPTAIKRFQTARNAPVNQVTPFAALWLAIAELASGRNDAESAKAVMIDLDKRLWPSPIIDLYAGRETVNSILNQSENSPAITKPARECEAKLFSGAWLRLHHDIAGAKPLMDDAYASCPDNNVDQISAAVLSRMPSP